MSICQGCNKPVYFAERQFCVGKNWHRACLRCGECNKVLAPGQHAEHRGQPYCAVPCHRALFGPIMFGHGSPIEAHNNFGVTAKPQSPIRRPDLQRRLKSYNNAFDSQTLQIKSKEVNGRLVLEGPLRVHWGVQQPIQFKEKEEEKASVEPGSLASTIGKDWQRRSYCMAINNGLSDDFLSLLDNGGGTLKGRQSSLEDLLAQWRIEEEEEEQPAPRERIGGTELRRYNTVSYKGDQGDGGNLRRRGRVSKRGSRRLSMINGHIFHSDTSIFLPSHDSVSTVTISSLDPTPEVIKLLLDKFKVENNPDDYCLCVLRKSGETKVLRPADFPLVDRVMMGPLEEEAKIFIKEKRKVQTISEEVAPFVNLPDAVLEGFLGKYKEELEQEVKKVTLRYQRLKEVMEKRLSEISTQM